MSQTSSNACSRVTTEPAFCISSWRSSNSLRRSSSTSPSFVTSRLAGSSRSSPISIGSSVGPPGGVGPPEDGADPRDDLACAERLDHVVVGAELEADDAVGLLAAGGQHDDRHPGALPELAADVEPGPVGKHHVEQDEVGLELRRELERLGRRSGDLRLEALTADRLGERLRDRRLVLDEEDRAFSLHSRRFCPLSASAKRPRLPGAADEPGRGRSLVVIASAVDRSCLRRGRSFRCRRRLAAVAAVLTVVAVVVDAVVGVLGVHAGAAPVHRGSFACSASSHGPLRSSPGSLARWSSCRTSSLVVVGTVGGRDRRRVAATAARERSGGCDTGENENRADDDCCLRHGRHSFRVRRRCLIRVFPTTPQGRATRRQSLGKA